MKVKQKKKVDTSCPPAQEQLPEALEQDAQTSHEAHFVPLCARIVCWGLLHDDFSAGFFKIGNDVHKNKLAEMPLTSWWTLVRFLRPSSKPKSNTIIKSFYFNLKLC